MLVSQDNGETNTYGLFYLQERGQLFLGPGIKVYGGQIIGLHSRDNDLVVNPSKAKKLTNIRTTAADEKLIAHHRPASFRWSRRSSSSTTTSSWRSPRKALRLRKRYLDENERKRLERARDAGLQGD